MFQYSGVRLRLSKAEGKASIQARRISGREGTIKSNKLKLIQAWIEIHKEDLMADWEVAVKGELPFPIEPLR